MLRSLCLAALPLLVSAGSVAAQRAQLELDHVFVFVTPGAKAEAELLARHGFQVDTMITRHTGQGTASRSVLFENAYLELIWVDSSVSTSGVPAATLADFRRAAEWRTSGASPFGVGLRVIAAGDYGVPTKPYSGPWMQPGTAIDLLRQESEPNAVELFVIPKYMAVPSWIGQVRTRMPRLLAHPNGAREVTAVDLRITASQRPEAIKHVTAKRLSFTPDSVALLTLDLDAHSRGETIDLRPTLPIIVRR